MTDISAAASDIGSAFATVAFSGSMLLAVPVALIAGVVSFASPCVLPLVPGYLGYLGGMSGAAPGPAQQSDRPAGGVGPATLAQLRVHQRPRRGRLLLGVALFVAGFTAVFVALGTVAGALGASLAGWQDTVTRLLGLVVIALGLSFMGFVPFLQNDLRPRSARAMAVLRPHRLAIGRLGGVGDGRARRRRTDYGPVGGLDPVAARAHRRIPDRGVDPSAPRAGAS